MIRIGFICTAGGSVVEAAYKIFKNIELEFDFYVVTDRECGAEVMAKKIGIPHKRFEITDLEEFSTEVAEWLYEVNQVDLIVLFSSRLIGKKVYETGKCFNVHPSILPSFPGLNALKATISHGAKFFGATLHQVDEGIDTGPIFAQIISPVESSFDYTEIQRISHAQKLYLLLKLIEENSEIEIRKRRRLNQSPTVNSYVANPKINENYILEEFFNYVSHQNIKIVTLG